MVIFFLPTVCKFIRARLDKETPKGVIKQRMQKKVEIGEEAIIDPKLSRMFRMFKKVKEINIKGLRPIRTTFLCSPAKSEKTRHNSLHLMPFQNYEKRRHCISTSFRTVKFTKRAISFRLAFDIFDIFCLC